MNPTGKVRRNETQLRRWEKNTYGAGPMIAMEVWWIFRSEDCSCDDSPGLHIRPLVSLIYRSQMAATSEAHVGVARKVHYKQLAPVFPGVGHKRGKFQLSNLLPLLRWPDSTIKTRDMRMVYQFQIPNVRQGATSAPNEEDQVA